MRKIISLMFVVILSMTITACTSNTGSTNESSVEKYKAIVQEYIDKGDIETAKKALQEGVSLTGDESLKKMLDEINASSIASDGEITSDSQNVTESTETPAIQMNMDTINSYINNELTFIDFDSKQETTLNSLPSINNKYIGVPTSYSVVDLDGDNAKELLVEYSMSGDTAILHIQNDTCVAYYMPYRGIAGLKIDGTAHYSNSAFESGIHSFVFTNDGISTKEIIKYDSQNEIYIVETKNVSEQECVSALDTYYNKESATYYDISQ